MEHPAALQAGGGTYRWHAGAPDDAAFAAAAGELRARLDEAFERHGLAPLVTEEAPPLDDAGTSLQGEPESGAGAPTPRPAVTRREAEYVAAYGEALLELAAREPRLVVLDADLASDCRVRSSSPSRGGSSRTGSPSRTWSRWRRAWPGTGSSPS